jgi:hypothetical protein
VPADGQVVKRTHRVGNAALEVRDRLITSLA